MRVCALATDWTPLLRLNREFHHRMFALSPYRLIESLAQRDHALGIAAMEAHRASTASGLDTEMPSAPSANPAKQAPAYLAA